MKNKLILIGAIALAGCSTHEQLVKQSDICLSNTIGTKLYFRDCERAQIVARAWHQGIYGPADVVVLDSAAWTRLEKRVVAHN